MENILEQLVEEVKTIINVENFNKYVNSREYELEVTRIAGSIVVDKKIVDDLVEGVKRYYSTNKPLSFTLFFIVYTICRRQSFGNVLDLALSYEGEFEEYEIMKHIKLMAVLDIASHSSTLYKAIKESSKLIELSNDECDFTNHVGVLNVYTGLICKYFEYQLDERKEAGNKELLVKALNSIKKVIELEKQAKGSYDAVYSKFYLNYGRILILLGKYNKGEEEIQRAISLLPQSNDRTSKVNEYNQYLLKASIIHSYDLNEEKIKDLDKIKVSNYKSIALMTTLLGFLLGTINIFTTISDPFTLIVLMVGYCGLLMVLLGTILLGFTLTLKERKVRLYVYDILILVAGILVFAFALITVINKGLI